MNQKIVGNVLVTLQFVILAVLAGMAWTHWQAADQITSWALLSLSAGVGLWALAANRPGNFNIHPTPHPKGQLVAHGPYRWIRHPMYTAVMLLGAALAWGLASPVAWLLWALLFGVLLTKALLEERWMLQAHPAYAAYRAGTRRFIPYLL